MRPVHKIKPSRSIIAYTWCGVEPYRRGIQSADAHNKGVATCKACLAEEAKAAKTAKVRHPIEATRIKQPTIHPTSSDYDTLVRLIETNDIGTVLSDIRTYLYRKIDGTDPAVDATYAVLLEASRKVREIMAAKKVTDWSIDEAHGK
jgi:hypothetical protein